MSDDTHYSTILGQLRGSLATFGPSQATYKEIVEPRDEVFARFQPILSLAHTHQLTADEFIPFLYFENNHHWSGLYRQGLRAASDVPALRRALALLLDESKSIRDRFPAALAQASGLGKGIATAVLTVAYPERYGVWNNTSEAALRELGLWQQGERGEGLGGRYERVNALLVRLAGDLGIDLWTLDALWWHILEHGRLPYVAQPLGESSPAELASFALERQLEDFLLENWDRTPMAHEWAIYSTSDDPEAGNQFPTEVGRIDILARHKTQPRYLVIELKRSQSTDETVGQALRYAGWVKQHLATQGETVEALLIAHTADRQAQYAISMVPNIRLMTYEIEFRLHEVGAISS